MVRIERVEDGRWLMHESGVTPYRCDFEDIEPPANERLAVLLTAPVGYREARVGRRVSSDVFWIFEKE